MLGIIGAMEIEVQALYERMTDVEIQTVAGMEFHKGVLEGLEVVAVRFWDRKGECGNLQPDSGGSVSGQCNCKYGSCGFFKKGN